MFCWSFNHILEDQSLSEWLHENLKYNVDMTPKRSPLQVKFSIKVLTDQMY